MAIQSGTKLGPYEILALLGAGGMGEVYRARDTRLARDVALKVLPPAFSADLDRLRRFEQEARAAGMLNHPNILTVHDIGSHADSPYIVSELLEGKTLRDHLDEGRVSMRKAVEYASQIAQGLAAAHEKQIVHRDLKPENLFVTQDGRIKILDFGLAKLKGALSGSLNSAAPTVAYQTDPGVVLGTVGYMSPEQVRGLGADHRSDIFAVGAVVYEMLTGNRAFRCDSTVETMNAILKEEPPSLGSIPLRVAPGLADIVEHCLEKDPEHRFQSARDLAFAFETVSGLSGSITAVETAIPARTGSRRLFLSAVVGVPLLAMGVASGVVVGRRMGIPDLPTYRRFTFRRGKVWRARFAPDGTTLVYSAEWNTDAIEIFTMRSESPESRSINLSDTDFLAVSSRGEMAVLRNPKWLWSYINSGTLARVPLAGGAPRDILEHVQEVDWSPDGNELAVTRDLPASNRLEYPIGKVLYETPGYLSSPRVSPAGDRVAFLDHQIPADNRGYVAVLDRGGRKTVLSGEWGGVEGLAWSHDGKEVWFTASKSGEAASLYGVTLAGKERAIARAPSEMVLHDISRDGRLLLATTSVTSIIAGLAPGETNERDLSWLSSVNVADYATDGRSFVFASAEEGGGADYTVWIRKTDGSPSIKLGEGQALALSPDGKWVLSVLYTLKQLVLLPTGAGEARRIERFSMEEVDAPASWLPDGKSIVFAGREPGHAMRSYLLNIDGGPPRPITPEGVFGNKISPDGRFVVANSAIYPLEGGDPRPIPGLDPKDMIVRWSADGRTMFISRLEKNVLSVYRLDLSTGRRELFKELRPPDPLLRLRRLFLTPDGKGYIHNWERSFSTLYQVDGLR